MSLMLMATGVSAQSTDASSNNNTQVVGLAGCGAPQGALSFAKWYNPKAVLSDLIFGDNISYLKGWKAIALRFATISELGDDSYALCQIYGTDASTPLAVLKGDITDCKLTNAEEIKAGNITWNDVMFSEPYTFTGNEYDMMYGYRFTDKEVHTPLYGMCGDASVEYSDMFLVAGQLESTDDERNTNVVSTEEPMVPCIMIVVQDPNGGTAAISLKGADKPVAQQYFSLDGKKLSAPQKGLNIVKMSDGTTHKVLVNK